MNQAFKKLLYFSPRVLSLMMVVFLMLFSLDVFKITTTTQDLVVGLVIHNLPALLLLITSIIAWKYELFGTVVFYIGAIIYGFMVFTNQLNFLMQLNWFLSLATPLVFIGTLYLLNYLLLTRKKDV